MSVHAEKAEQILADFSWQADPFAAAQAHALLALAAEQCTANKLALVQSSAPLSDAERADLWASIVDDLGVSS